MRGCELIYEFSYLQQSDEEEKQVGIATELVEHEEG